jgi:hypothetical protein
MVRPDALPVRALDAVAVCPAATLEALFGAAALRGTERITLVRLGRSLASVRVEAGSTLSLRLDAITAVGLSGSATLRMQGPRGVVDAPPPTGAVSRLVLPDGLRSAWRVGAHATVALGPVALGLPVEPGREACVDVDRALWLGAGRPDTARWLPGVDLAPPVAEAPAADGPVRIPRHVVTETDVRQARLRRQTIRIEPGQVVTPAALSMGREHGVFA